MNDVIVRSGQGLAQDIQIGQHHLLADEPVEVGGADSGPNPYELLLAALGACTAMTVRLYAQRKSWPLESVQVSLQHERIHAADCEACETQEGYLDKITKHITLQGNLDTQQRQRLVQIAEQCPVNRTLRREIVVEQRAVPAD